MRFIKLRGYGLYLTFKGFGLEFKFGVQGLGLSV